MSAKVALAFVAMLAFVNSQSYLDALVQQIMPEPSDQPKSNCLCKGPACICCVDFNMTFLDLGGPGCIHMKYISPEEGLSVKVTYDKKFLQSSKIKGPHPTPVCVNLYGVHAQVCANFNDLAPTADGLRGCSKLELKLLGSSQLEFPIGCFKSSAGVMEMEDPPVEPEKEETTEEPTTEDTNIFDPEAFLINIYQTAEEGVAFLGSLLNIPSKKNSTTTEQPATTPISQESNSQRRSPKHFKHPNQL